MNCANHPEIPATAYCRTCGKPLCEECKRHAEGTIFCAEHDPAPVVPPVMPPPSPAAAAPEATMYTAPAAASAPPVHTVSGVSPGLAFLLGLIPGVGAIYNGQYAKGLIHAVVFGILISVLDSHPPHGLEPLVVMLMTIWFFYMAFEAYHTARKRRDGEQVEELSSLIDLNRATGRFPMGAVVLIVLGVILLLDQMNIFPLERIIRFWPVGLIAIGVYMLVSRLDGGGMRAANLRPDSAHERRS